MSFEVTDEMRARYRAWVDRVTAETGMLASELIVEHEPWMHPLDALATITSKDGVLPPEERPAYRDAVRTSSGLGERAWRNWIAQAMGIASESVKQYEADRPTYDLDHPTAVYRYFDADGRLLYVGVAKDPDKRQSEHALTAAWYPYFVRREDTWHSTRSDALAEERAAVRDEMPIFNLHMSSGDPDEAEEYLMWRDLDLIAEAVTR